MCVTGGAGFIGSHLCEALLAAGAETVVLDDFSSGSRDNLPAHTGESRLRVVEGSILDREALAEATRGTEVIFHQAALTSVPGSVEQPELYLKVNTHGTLMALEAARAAGGRPARVVYASSSSVYGDCGRSALDETMAPQPASPYAASKCAGEHLLTAYARCFDLTAVSLRYFNVFGPRQRPDSPYAAVIPRWADAMLAGGRPVVFGDGSQTRDFTHVANAVRANLLAGASPRPLRGEALNVACGHSCDLLALLKMMAGILGVEPSYDSAPARVGDVMHSRADVSAARELLGYRPTVALDEGLRETLEHYRRAVIESASEQGTKGGD